MGQEGAANFSTIRPLIINLYIKNLGAIPLYGNFHNNYYGTCSVS